MTKELQELNKDLSYVYRHAAGGVLEWSQEKSFFEAQIRRNPQINKAVRNKAPATIESLKLAVRECAGMGLSMSPNASLVYFIPRRAWKPKPGENAESIPLIVTATPSYRGLAYIAMHYAGAEQVCSEVVYADDEFQYRGPMEKPKHVPTLDNSKRHEKTAIGVYALVKMQTGDYRCEYVDAPTVQKIRQLSEFPNSMMWTKLWTEGWRKVPIRRICKTVMVTDKRMAVAVEAMNRDESIIIDPEHDRHTADDKPTGVDGLKQAMQRPPVEDEMLALPNPVSTTHPPGSIEWWLAQLNGADSLERMDEIKAAALLDRVDMSDDADTFRDSFAKRCKEIRADAA